ncbi:MAG: hypothetical protein Q8L13_11675 [Bradyrhizobium sp.]|uniref:hypothetical protein n=1 Tax=Bradyrhizobium sp. TaxID=376 RepID=UPI002731C5CB|nr:hypothetical protein [Bradyrhizobium sp.]MDP1866984.1 hypothetical protein [Bradyrhizobium sp.]
MTSLRAQIIDILTTRRWPLSDEKALQPLIETEFAAAGIAGVRREVHLGPHDIVDFMIGGLAIEVKVKGQRRSIFRQLERYCSYAEVSEIILATNVPMSLPPEICGKPARVAALGRGWL